MSWGRPVTEMSAGWKRDGGEGERKFEPARRRAACRAGGRRCVLFFSTRLASANVRAPTQIYVGCAGTARSADNLKGARNRRASIFI
jgi:hypothetical protein